MSSSQGPKFRSPLRLSQIKPGQRCQIYKIHGLGRQRQRFLDMGLVRDTEIEVFNFAPLGDPLYINLRGCSLAIRRREAEQVEVILLESVKPSDAGGVRNYETTLPWQTLNEVAISTPIWRKGSAETAVKGTILLAGNPNCGKSTLFNALTGAHQHVGNWPGKTIEKKEGLWVEQGLICRVIDLPGTYSLAAYSLEEIIARDAILDRTADLVAIVIDASNLERNLYLALQILEMGVRAILVLNMWDVAQSNGLRIDVDTLASRLGIPVLPTTLSTGKGLAQLRKQLIDSLQKEEVLTIESSR